VPLASYLAYEHVAGAGGGISSEVDIGGIRGSRAPHRASARHCNSDTDWDVGETMSDGSLSRPDRGSKLPVRYRVQIRRRSYTQTRGKVPFD